MYGRVVHARFGPILSALLLSLIMTPLAAAGISRATVSPWDSYRIDAQLTLDPVQAGPMALLAVLAAGLVGGTVAGTLVRRAPVLGLVLAVFLAWPVAIATLPILPTLRGETFAAGWECLDSCSSKILAGQPWSGVAAYGESIQLGALFVVPAVAAIILVILAWFAAKRGVAAGAAGLGLAAFVALNLVSVQQGGIAFVGLLVGAVVWVAPYWKRWQRLQPRPVSDPLAVWPGLSGRTVPSAATPDRSGDEPETRADTSA